MTSRAMLLMILLLLLGVSVSPSPSPSPAPSRALCPPDKLAVYRMLLQTYWTRDNFPKHYPDWRPSAQWSQVTGRTHDSSFVLFREGSPVSAGVRALAEGHAPQEEVMSVQGVPALPGVPGVQGARGVLDTFTAPAIAQGRGRSEGSFFVDGNHSKVSLMCRMVPSPDWFVGVDSFDLCLSGNWLDSITIEVDPIDAGTDNGFTFTAPNWPTSPQGVAARMSARFPAHPAGSFYYPHAKRLPPIATFQFIKVKEYEVTEVFQQPTVEMQHSVAEPAVPADEENSIAVLDGNLSLERAIQEEREEQEPHPLAVPGPRVRSQSGARLNTPSNRYYISSSTENVTNTTSEEERQKQKQGQQQQQQLEERQLNQVPRGDKGAILSSIARSYRGKAIHHHKHRVSRDCRVSGWSEWSSCSRTCGVGEARRQRRVLRAARRAGRACPPLMQTRWCGNPTDCHTPFSW